MNLSSISDLQLDQMEYCFTIGDQLYYNNVFAVHFPKLMPLVQKGSTIVFNRNILVNDTKCKPTLANSIKTQNFISIPRSENCNLKYLANGGYMVPNGTRLTCSCNGNNLQDMCIVNNL